MVCQTPCSLSAYLPLFVTAYICIINLMKHHCAVRPCVRKPKLFFLGHCGEDAVLAFNM